MKIKGLKQLSQTLEKAGQSGFRTEAAKWLEQAGTDFLDLVRDEIVRAGSIDTGSLLRSFKRGSEGNSWEIEKGGLTLEVGTELEYASFVNDGHWSGGKDEVRWIPGQWHGGRFQYDPGSSSGMALKRQWVKGTGYWEHALYIFERLFEKRLHERLQTWLNSL
ncbi:HK97 gp10 family phage protein [Bacillus haynesii]|uniref:HK97 gp10 family phage protein n=1 Tax=Bacillus haynesii TaxID=1925021 RepID=UPI00228048A0|nr:HK97 gp10 family phage protein [Bacillus haynesii]MCY7754107.1 HK97 gp10 family phage protein [Bacillus haynesii]MCY7861044.1 HK97 gp10 family phage protein [Bacillus haynesii]MCY8003323.1 HK97 gp10 family phage protein [Bacillus haynesii]MCY8067606.1 HK97 gp10 family phage protein [Bacillus haynesii]MCY8342195.1 HK97 gp10 family phage protein [Bacillus haynesii]